jgi:BTB/POZ domain-containing protein 3/6
MIGGNGGAVHIQQGAEYGSFTQQYACPNVQVTQPGSCPTSPVGVPRPLSANSSDSAGCDNANNAVAQLCRSLEVLSTSDPNWQSHKCNVRERNAAVFNNELMADVHFVVGTTGE